MVRSSVRLFGVMVIAALALPVPAGAALPPTSCQIGGWTFSITIFLGGTVFGTPGNDVFLGSPGADLINATQGGNDAVCPSDGDDDITFGPGSDRADGGNGYDKIRGGGGNDFIWGGLGPDSLAGQDGDDFVYGDAFQGAGVGDIDKTAMTSSGEIRTRSASTTTLQTKSGADLGLIICLVVEGPASISTMTSVPI